MIEINLQKQHQIVRKSVSDKAKARWSMPGFRERVRKSISEATKLAMARSEVFKKMSEGMKKVWQRSGYKEKMKLKRICTPEKSSKISESLKKTLSSPEERKRLSDQAKEVCSRPGHKERLSKRQKEVCNRPGWKEKHSEIMKAILADPQIRCKMSEKATLRMKRERTVTKNTKIEKKVEQFLQEINAEFEVQKVVYTPNGVKLYDFYLPQSKTLIEIHGQFWHADPRFYTGAKLSPAQVRNIENDKVKKSLAENCGLKLVEFWEYDIKKSPEIVKEKLKALTEQQQ